MRNAIAWVLTSAALAGLTVQSPRAAFAQAPVVTVDECRSLSDTEVRDRIRELAATGLKAELTAIDYPLLVSTYWLKVDVNARIDREVDAAIAAVRGDTSWFDRAYSTVSQSSATRYATAVADKVYNSDGFKAAMAELATAIAKDAGAQIEKATAKVSNPIIACVQATLQGRYGGAVAQVFAQESQKDVNATSSTPAVKIDTADLVLNSSASISGLVLIVTRRIIAEIVESVGSRIAGIVASRIVSSVAGLVGLALIAKDVYQAGSGVFPIIEERMKSDETKTLIKNDVGKSIQADITQQVGTIAQETSDRIYAAWLDFKQKYNRLLTLSEKSPAFAEFLKDRRIDQLGRLGQIVDLLYKTEGEERVLARVADGSLNRALLDLSDDGLIIAEQQQSIGKALKWTALAGRNLPRVVELGIYRWLSPEGLSQETLDKVLSLNDKIAVSRIANLDAAAREVILSLPANEMHDLARRLNDRQLAAFADYQQHLQPAAARVLSRAVAEDPTVMRELAGTSLRQAILDSRDQLSALNMILNEDSSPFGVLSYGRIVKDAELVSDGYVGFRVFWERYWVSILVAALAIVLILSWLRRLLFGRPRVIVQEQSKGRAR